MRNVRRYFNPGDTCFITSVTYNRRPILVENIELLYAAFSKVKVDCIAEFIAWVVLPDHMHLLLNSKQTVISDIVHKTKLSFAAKYRHKNKLHGGRVWQNRFWDHIIRDENDMNRHLDYIHFNPVKHGYVKAAVDYEYSSFGVFLNRGLYTSDWGVVDDEYLEGNFGE